jgi:hypothetical protein
MLVAAVVLEMLLHLLAALEVVVLVVKTVVPQDNRELQIWEAVEEAVLIRIRLAAVVDQVL